MTFKTLTEQKTWLFRGFCYSGSMEDVFVGVICHVLASSTTGYTGMRLDTSTWLGEAALVKPTDGKHI